MKNHKKKMVAPAIITILFVVYYLGIAAAFFMIPEIPVIMKIVFTVVPLGLAAVMVGVFISRIKEIKGGEEDDLSKY